MEFFFTIRHFDRVSTTLRFARNDEGEINFFKKMFFILKKVVILQSVL